MEFHGTSISNVHMLVCCDKNKERLVASLSENMSFLIIFRSQITCERHLLHQHYAVKNEDPRANFCVRFEGSPKLFLIERKKQNTPMSLQIVSVDWTSYKVFIGACILSHVLWESSSLLCKKIWCTNLFLSVPLLYRLLRQ